MSWLAWIVVIAGTLAVMLVVVWFFTGRTPEQADSHADGSSLQDESARGRPSGGDREGPAEPGAESQRPDGRGPLLPGP
jgi:hypothetical protein